VVFFTRTIRAVFLVFFLLPSVAASAGDYTVSYAFDAGDVNDAGKTEECEFAHVCRITSEKLNLTISLSFFYPDHDHPRHHEVHVRVYGSNGGTACCYFADGVDSVVRDAGSSIRLHVYRGRKRIRNEYIQNEPFGTLYLQFPDMK
jgi:hypothetical protein